MKRRVPPVALLMSAGLGIGAAIVVIAALAAHGQAPFFERGDERLFWLTTRDLFGTGHGFAALGRTTQIPYRYGRAGLPFVAWLLALGHPGWVGVTLIAVNLVAIAAIPGLAATLLDGYDVPPVAGLVVLLVPGLLVLIKNVVAEPFLVALILLAYVLDQRERRGAAKCVMAYAILVKEVAVLALVPWLWRAVKARDRAAIGRLAATLVPYAAWCAWLRWRVGEFPFLAHDADRSGALSLPFVGIHDAIAQHTPDYRIVVTMVLATALLGAVAAWMVRGTPLGTLAAAFTLLSVCLGPQALRFEGETIRVLVVPQVFALLALVQAISRQRRAMQMRSVPPGTGVTPVGPTSRSTVIG